MRLVQVKLTNFRCYKDETTIDIDNLTVFVGRNDAGKSSIFDALSLFFDEKASPEGDDCSVHGDDKTVRITCIFENFPRTLIIDAQHETSLASEYMLNQDRKLELTKIYTCQGAGKGKLKGVFAKAKHPSVDGYADLLALTNTKLKQRAQQLSIDLAGVNQSVNSELRRAIWAHPPDLACQETDIELKSEAAGSIWEQLKKHIPVFAVFKSDRPSTDQDAEAQDPLKAAIKEAIKSQEEILNSISDQVKREVQEIADRTVQKIREMDAELANQLTPRVANKNWDSLFSVSLTGDNDIPINKRGSGTRRLVLLNFFRAKAEQDAQGKGTGIIYAIEEPETSQHPHNQILLVEALDDLAEQAGVQVLLTTHTPMLARRFNQTSLRLVCQRNGQPSVSNGTEENTLLEIVNSLGVLPDHNIKVFFGVEGRNDITFLRTISKILHDAGEDIPDLGKAEDQGHLLFIPMGGSSLDLWLFRLRELNRQEYYITDRDTCPPEAPKYQSFVDQKNRQPNCCAWITSKKELENYVHKDIILDACPTFTGNGGDFEDVPLLLAKAFHEASDSPAPWADVLMDQDKLDKKISNSKRRLNNEFVSKMTPALLTQVDTENNIRTWLRETGRALNA